MISRRDFISGALAAGAILGSGALAKPIVVQGGNRRVRALPAKLLPSRHLSQVLLARDTYLAIPNDDLLFGFRKRAGQPTPGRAMTGCGCAFAQDF